MKRLAMSCALFALLCAPAFAVAASSLPNVDRAALGAAGGRVAVVWNGTLFTMAARDGVLHRVAVTPAAGQAIADLRWAGRGSRLKFTVGDVAWTVNADGSAPHRVPSVCGGAQYPCIAVLSPDRKAYAYVATPPFPQNAKAVWSDALFTVHPPARPVRRYVAHGAGISLIGWYRGTTGLLFWPDPNHSASIAADGLDLVALPQKGKLTRLVTMVPHREWLAFDAARDSVLAVAGQFRMAWTSKKLERCNLTVLRCNPLPLPKGYVTLDPAWSPVSDRIAYVRARDHGVADGFDGDAPLRAWLHTRVLYLDDAHGRHPRPLPQAGTNVYAPAFRHDGSALTFVRDDALWLLALGGGAPQRIVGPFPNPPAAIGDHGETFWSGYVAWSPR
jgi:hypothetical protein